MKVSVIVPVYNQEKYLAECLDSVLSQTLQDFEIICINDCSTDRSAEIMAEYEKKDARIKCVQNQVNGGLSFSRNQGLKIASGDYLFFLDSDDMLIPTTLEELCAEADKENTDVIFFDSQMKVESDKVSKEEQEYCTKGEYDGVMTGKYFLREMQKINEIRIPACLQFWNRVRFHEMNLGFGDGLLHEDILFTYMGLAKAERVVCLKRPFYVYRRHDNSITLRKISPKYLESLIHIYQIIMNYWSQQENDPELNAVTKNYLGIVQWKIDKYASEVDESADELKGMWGWDSFYTYWYNVLVTPPVVEAKVELVPEVVQAESQIPNVSQQEADIKTLLQLAMAKVLYIYGAGKIATKYITIIQKYNIPITGIVVSEIGDNPAEVLGIPVYEIKDVMRYKDECTVLVGVGKKLKDEIKNNLYALGFEKFIEWN